MRTRRQLLVALGAGALAKPLAAFAQQSAKVPRIGFLISETLSGQANRIEALRTGLRDLDYVEGKTIAIELRSADGNYDRLPELAGELARLKVSVIVAFGAKAVLAAKGTTTTIPIVVPLMGDPVALGVSSSLARPSANITGSSIFLPEISRKRLQLLKEVVPRIVRVAVLLNPAGAGGPVTEGMRDTAKALKLELKIFEVRAHREFNSTFSALAKVPVDAIVVSQDTLFIANASEIAELAAKQRLPSVGNQEFAEAGGLLGYSPREADLYRRGAYFVDRILKGAKPGDLPIEQATNFELVVNLKTAKALGILPSRISLPRYGSRVGLRIVLFEACSAFTRVTACTLALSPYFVTRLSEGFSHLVTSMTAPVASGWSGRRVGFAPTGKRRLVTAHAKSGRPIVLASSLFHVDRANRPSLNIMEKFDQRPCFR